MSAFGHAGFGSSNRRNQLRAQGQIGGDQYGQGVRSAMQAPTFNIYQAPSTYQQATGTQTQQPAQPPVTMPTTQQPPPTTPFPTNQSSQPPPTTPFPTDRSSQPSVPSPGTAQPIPPQSQGTPYSPPPSDRYSETNEERMSRPYLLPGESQPMTYQQRLETARPGAVESVAQEWNSTPAGSQKRDWEGDTVRSMLKGGLSPDMAANVLLNTGRFAGNPTGARQFADQTEQDWIASLSSGPPQALGPNATASEVSDYLTASTAYARQQRAQQERDERLAAEAAFNDPARSAAGWRPSGEHYNSRGQRFNGIIYNPSSAYRMDASGNLVPYSTQATPGSSGRPVTEETPDQMRYDYNKTPNPTAQSQNVSPKPASHSVQSPGTAQPIPPQSQGTPYTRRESPGEQLQREQDEAMDSSSPSYWMNDPAYQQQQWMFANQPPEAYRPPTAEELAPVPQWNPTMPSQATTDRTYGFAPGERTTVYSGTDRQTSVPSAQFAFEQENWNQRAQDAVDRQAVYNAMNPARSQQLLAARGMGDDAFREWSAYSGEDPRAGLSPSQSAIDQIAQIRRNQQIRSDPISYYRELQAQGLV